MARHFTVIIFVILFICIFVTVLPAHALTKTERLKDIKHLFDTLEKNYAYTWLKKVDWNQLREKYLSQVNSHQTDAAHYELLTQILKELKDSHCLLINPTLKPRYNPGFTVEQIEGQYFVTSVTKNSPAEAAGIQKGWELLQVNTKAVPALLQEFNKHIMGSAQWVNAYSINLLPTVTSNRKQQYDPTLYEFRTSAQEKINITLSVKPKTPLVERSYWHWDTEKPLVRESWLPGNVAYVKINGFSHKRGKEQPVSQAFKNVARHLAEKKASGLVLDLRNTNGGFGEEVCRLFGYFMPGDLLLRQTCYPKSKNCIVQDKKNLRLTHNYKTIPQAEQFDGPVVLITNSYCRSACDMFSAAFKMTGRGHIIGQTTAGAGGTYSCERLPSGTPFCFTTWPVILADGSIVEGNGIKADQEIVQTKKDFIASKDTLLIAAQEHIKKYNLTKRLEVIFALTEKEIGTRRVGIK